MKILTIAIPCYNSAAYMKKAINFALVGGEDVEVLIVDDGSTKDNTFEIAQQYEKEHPGQVRAIHQENKGHGGAVNTALAAAEGIYFKVCDSDDWLDGEALTRAIQILKEAIAGSTTLDALISNFVYEKAGARKKRIMRYVGSFPEDRIFTWDEVIKPLNVHRYVLMHSLIYRTQLLRDCGLHLPEHTFYVDNLVVFQPMIYVKTLYYLNMPLYRYFIGRDDQSVNETVMLTRMDQQLRVTKLMIDEYRPDLVKKKNQMDFLVHYMNIMMEISSILLIRKESAEALVEKDELWQYLKKKDLRLYVRLRYGFLGRMVNMPGEAGRKFAVKGYELVQKYYGFN